MVSGARKRSRPGRPGGAPGKRRVDGEQHRNQDSEAQRTDHHVERAGDLLGQVVAVDRIGRRFRITRGERDANGQVRDREDEQQPAERRDDRQDDLALDQLTEQPPRDQPGDHVEHRHRDGVVQGAVQIQ